MNNNSILIISNHEEVSNIIIDKIKLLRECDTIKSVSTLEAISVLNSSKPSLIILYWAKADSIQIVKEIRTIHSLDSVPIIFVMDSLIEEILFKAFDYGIDEFFYLQDPDSVILMRIFLTLQKSVLYNKIDNADGIMQATGIKDKKTGIYSNEFAPAVLSHLFNKSLEENVEKNVFMFIKPVVETKKYINLTKIANVIRTVPRANDVVAFARSVGLYLILYRAGKAGAKSVIQRIQHAVNGMCEIYANAVEITAPFEELEPVLFEGIDDQISAKNHFNYFYESDVKDSLELLKSEENNNLIFQRMKKDLYSQLEKIAIQVFYHIQTVYSAKYPKTVIKYNVSPEECYFSVTQGNIQSKLVVFLTSHTQLTIDVNHSENEKVVSKNRVTYNAENFSEEILTSVLKGFLHEFSEISSHSEIAKTKSNEK